MAKVGKLGAIYEGSTSMSSSGAGQRIAGVTNWFINESADALDQTSFDSSGKREFLAGCKSWSGGAEAFWTTGGTTAAFDSWTGSTKFVRLFVQWTSTPTAPKPAIYYYGKVKVVTGRNVNTPYDGLIKDGVTFVGCSNLTLVTIPSTWSSTAP